MTIQSSIVIPEFDRMKVMRAIPSDLCLLTYRGSVAHGTYVAPTDPYSTDDIDLMGMSIPGADYTVGLREWGSRGTKEMWVDEYDIVLYDYRKMLSLLMNANPNVLSMLWVEPECIIIKDTSARMLIDKRDLFSTKKVYPALVGYAHGQLKRMKNWAQGEGRYLTGHMGEKRKRLVEEFGYDSKNAAHLIRLLDMGVEFFKTGVLRVYRPDQRERYLQIKRGEWDMLHIDAESDRLFKEVEEAKDASRLPEAPDFEKVNDLAVDMWYYRWIE